MIFKGYFLLLVVFMHLKRVGRENKDRLLVVYCFPKVPTIY